MRTRETIESESVSDGKGLFSVFTNSQGATADKNSELILEVVLDIRDILIKNPHHE